MADIGELGAIRQIRRVAIRSHITFAWFGGGRFMSKLRFVLITKFSQVSHYITNNI